jgi:DNA-binding LacI/PurR family transcriptional regulator
MRKVTIEDISRDTGLSRGTVSRALNDRPDISTQTKQRVLEACRKLDYVPSHAARSLATGRNYAVAVLVEDLRTAFAVGVVRGVIARAQQERYAVHVIETGPSPEPERLRVFSAERIDGVLNAIPLERGLANELQQYVENRILASCWPLEGVSCDVLTPDHAEAGRMLARFLVRNQALQILYVHRNTSHHASNQRLSGFEETCRENQLNPNEIVAVVDGPDAIDELGTRMQDANAIVADDDYLAVSTMLVCERMGRQPGRDVAIIGCGNEPVSAAMYPSLTTIDFDSEELGRRMMETLLQRLSKRKTDAAQELRVAPVLVERATTMHFPLTR